MHLPFVKNYKKIIYMNKASVTVQAKEQKFTRNTIKNNNVLRNYRYILSSNLKPLTGLPIITNNVYLNIIFSVFLLFMTMFDDNTDSDVVSYLHMYELHFNIFSQIPTALQHTKCEVLGFTQ